VREFQARAILETDFARTIAVIVATAEEFDARIEPDAKGYANSPGAVLHSMMRNASDRSRPVIEALNDVVRSSRSVRVA
jgi:hypothetical protein